MHIAQRRHRVRDRAAETADHLCDVGRNRDRSMSANCCSVASAAAMASSLRNLARFVEK
jgi:hypothetical protein